MQDVAWCEGTDNAEDDLHRGSDGDRRRIEGRGRTTDGQLDLALRMPTELGGPGDAANPEQLLAIGWVACFEATLVTAAHRNKISMKSVADATIDARVMLMVEAAEAL
jgi:organic hydroperoxide reductase OsmC/OhrA